MKRFNNLSLKQQGPAFLIGSGHGATHWLAAVFYVLLPFITEDLGISYAEAGVFVAIFHTSSMLANFGSGVIVDLSGQRVLYQIISLLIGTVALIAFGLSDIYIVMCIMVALIGASNNLWHPAAISFLSSLYPKNRGYALSIHALGASVGDAIAPLVAGSLLLIFSWQHTAIISALPVFLLTAVFFIYLLPKDTSLSNQSKRGLQGKDYLSGMKSLIKQKAILGLCLMSSFRSTAQVGLLMFLPLYLVDELQVSPVVMGTTIMALHIAGLLASPIAGILSDRIGRRPVVLAGLTGTTVVVFSLTFISNMLIYVSAVAILGFVLYAVRPVVHSWLMDLAPPELGASATSVMFGAQASLSILMPLIGGLVADSYGLPAVFYLIAIIILIANALVFLLPKHEAQVSFV